MKVLWMLGVLLLLVLHVQSIRLCGSELPKMLRKICANGYDTNFKRTSMPLANDGIENAEPDTDLGNYGFGQLVALKGESANQLMKIQQRSYGINDECCQKSCTFAELADYCQ